MTSTIPRVVAGVVTYNHKALLRQCLTALREQTHPLADIVVVDNASSDGTVEMVENEFPEITLRVFSENRGVGHGFCNAVQAATEQEADWIWMMDDDAEPHPEALEQLFSVGLHDRSDTVALTSLKQFPSGAPQYDHSGWYDPVSGEITPVEASSEAWTEVGGGGYAGLLCRMDIIKRVGPPDPDFFSGTEILSSVFVSQRSDDCTWFDPVSSHTTFLKRDGARQMRTRSRGDTIHCITTGGTTIRTEIVSSFYLGTGRVAPINCAE